MAVATAAAIWGANQEPVLPLARSIISLGAS
jgi:hypothetical protein